ncbi:MAG: hypothetical protein ACLTGU_21480 [Escherichia coli]
MCTIGGSLSACVVDGTAIGMCIINGKRRSDQSLAAGAVAAINSLNPPAYSHRLRSAVFCSVNWFAVRSACAPFLFR